MPLNTLKLNTNVLPSLTVKALKLPSFILKASQLCLPVIVNVKVIKATQNNYDFLQITKATSQSTNTKVRLDSHHKVKSQIKKLFLLQHYFENSL